MNDFFLKPGTILRSSKRNYKIVKVLGHGGFGITYLVESDIIYDELPTTVRFALKEHFINSLCSRDPQTQHVVSSQPVQKEVDRSMRAFISEAQRLQKLGISHSNIVKVNEVFEANSTAYFVMEYLDGGSLADYVQGRGRLSFAEMAALMEPVCNSVAMLHRNSVAHYDIKPQNIMLVNRKGQLSPVLIDFGLAKHYDGQGNATSSIAAAGYTPGYAPMEQYAGFSTFQPTADVYALGATILFCLTGHNPAPAQELNLDEVRNELTALNISASVIDALLSALEFRSKDRPADAGAFAAAIFDGSSTATTENKYSSEMPVSRSTVKMPPKPSVTTPSGKPTEAISAPTSPRKRLKTILRISGVVYALALAYALALVIDFVISLGGDTEPEQIMLDTVAVKAAEYEAPVQEEPQPTEPQQPRDPQQSQVQPAPEPVLTAAQMCQKGKEYYDKKQYSEAVPCLRKSAQQGNADAQYLLGKCYFNGWGVTEDESQAAAWWRKAAEQGYAEAQCALGICYSNGIGVTQDYTQAVAWYRKAAEQGNADAQYLLGECYYNGWGVTQDYTQAAVWWRKAAEKGYAEAQCSLGMCYHNGEGVTKDYTQAFAWWRKAAEQGNADAQCALGFCYDFGWGVTPNKSEALYWYRKAAAQGDSLAKRNVQELESQGYR